MKRITKRMSALIILFLLTLIGCTKANVSSTKSPNIIYILADDLGYGDIGSYGQKQILTPNLDKMASEGMRFTQNYTGSTVCAPSRCSLMTGLHTGHSAVRKNGDDGLGVNDLTVAQVLKKSGYTTGLIGKWGLGEYGTEGDPNKKGFDYFYGYTNQTHAHTYYPDWLWRNGSKVALQNIVVRQNQNQIGSAAIKRVEYSPDLFTREAIGFIEQNKDKPFFLYLTYTIPHANNESQKLINKHGMEVPDYGVYNDKDWPEPQKGYAAMISYMDKDIGTLLNRLKELDLDNNTIVFFSSDNGPHKEGVDPNFFDSNGPLRGIKRDLYEGGIRTPLIVRWPNVIKNGSISNHVVAFWDLLPTVCELAGTSIPQGIDGISYLPELLGFEQKQKEHPYLYWEFHENGGSKAVRMGDWKGVQLNADKNPSAPIELYDLNTDNSETNDVAAKNPEIVAKIKDIMKEATKKQ